MFTLSISFELTVATQGKSWVSNRFAGILEGFCFPMSVHLCKQEGAEEQGRIKTKGFLCLKA